MAKCSCPLSHLPSLISLCYFPLSFPLSQSTESTVRLGVFHKQGGLHGAAMEGNTNGLSAFHVQVQTVWAFSTQNALFYCVSATCVRTILSHYLFLIIGFVLFLLVFYPIINPSAKRTLSLYRI